MVPSRRVSEAINIPKEDAQTRSNRDHASGTLSDVSLRSGDYLFNQFDSHAVKLWNWVSEELSGNVTFFDARKSYHLGVLRTPY